MVLVDRPGRCEVVADPSAGPAPPTGAEPVELELVSAGICGTDLSVAMGTNPLARYPLVLGHECLARVVGGAASGWQVGDHALVFPTLSCGSCATCRAGRENRCAQMAVLGLSHPYGCFRTELRLPAAQLFRLATGLAERLGPLVEPLAVASHVLGQAGVRAGERIAVFGAGTIGICTALAARARGVATVGLVDRLHSRRATASRCGFDVVVVLDSGEPDDATLWRAFGQVDVVVDTVGTTSFANAGLALLVPGGRYVAIGSPHTNEPLAVDYELLYGRELSIIAARNYTRRDFAAAVELVEGHDVDPTPLITGRYPLASFGAALDQLTRHPDRHLKILVHPDR